MATLTITKKSICIGGNHFTLTFTLGANTVNIPMSRDMLDAIDVNQDLINQTFIGLIAILARIYTPAQLASKINTGISVTL